MHLGADGKRRRLRQPAKKKGTKLWPIVFVNFISGWVCGCVAWKSVVWLGDKKAKRMMSILMSFVELVSGEPEGWVWVGLVVRYDGIEVRVWGRFVLKGSRRRWLVIL
jgi:hypothetical protein